MSSPTTSCSSPGDNVSDDANTTQLSLPPSFDDSLCLDLYRCTVVSYNRSSSGEQDGERKRRSGKGGVDNGAKSNQSTELRSQINGLNRQLLLLRDDLKSTQRESAIHQQRAHQLETDLRGAEASLESLKSKHEREIAVLRKTEHECQEAVARAKERLDEEIHRQTKLRSDEQNDAIERLSLAQSENADLKSNISSLIELNTVSSTAYYSVSLQPPTLLLHIQELESQLEESRRELKVSICRRKSVPEACGLSNDDRFAELQSAFTQGIGRLEHIVTHQQEEILRQRSLLLAHAQAEKTKAGRSLQMMNDRRSEGNRFVKHCDIEHPLSIHMFHHKTQRMKTGASSSEKVSKRVMDSSE